MARVDQLQVDPSPTSSVIIIAPSCLMILDVFLCWLNVWNLMPLVSIRMQLVSCQRDQFAPP